VPVPAVAVGVAALLAAVGRAFAKYEGPQALKLI